MSSAMPPPSPVLEAPAPTNDDARGRKGSGGKTKGSKPSARDRKGVGGRPPKFTEPSRPITLTLPESTLEGLRLIDEDRGQAIVKLTQQALRSGDSAQPQVEIMEMAANIGVLIIGPSSALRRIPFLHLVEVAPARFLLALDPGNDFKNLEIAIHDVLEDVPENDERERALIAQLLQHIRNVRKNSRVRMAEILFVNIGDHTKR